MRKCPNCGEIKLVADFYKGNVYCKPCVKEKARVYARNNPLKVKASWKKYADTNRAKQLVKKRNAVRYVENKEKLNAQCRDYYINNRENSRSRHRRQAINLTDGYVRKMFRKSGCYSPTPEQIEQRRVTILEERKKRESSEKIESCRRCLHCGIYFRFRPGGRNKDGGKYCNPVCKSLATRKPELPGSNYRFPQSRIRVLNCEWCGVLFAAHSPGKCCSDDCNDEKVRVTTRSRNSGSKQVESIVCKECGNTFFNNYGTKNTTFCSSKCMRRHNQRVSRHMRRARERNAPCERVDPRKVFERDGYVCQICGRHTELEKRGTIYLLAPELDHVIPLSRGGSHTYGNTQCACRECNQYKGANLQDEIDIPWQTQKTVNPTLPSFV